MEMADVLWVLICLTNQTGVNLTEAFEEKYSQKPEQDNNEHLDNKIGWLVIG